MSDIGKFLAEDTDKLFVDGVARESTQLTVIDVQEHHVMLRTHRGRTQWYDNNSDEPLKYGDTVTLKVVKVKE